MTLPLVVDAKLVDDDNRLKPYSNGVIKYSSTPPSEKGVDEYHAKVLLKDGGLVAVRVRAHAALAHFARGPTPEPGSVQDEIVKQAAERSSTSGPFGVLDVEDDSAEPVAEVAAPAVTPLRSDGSPLSLIHI